MGCTSCGTSSSGTPKGCKSNGHCASGGCNKLNTFDWFQDMPISFGSSEFNFHEISFKKGVSKAFFKNDKKLSLTTGDMVVVQTPTGQDVGDITLSGELVRLQMKKKGVKENNKEIGIILRQANEADCEALQKLRDKEKENLLHARVIARNLNLEMKISDFQYQGDGKKATFYYIADGRVDFRELIKLYASEFKVKVEMKQIGARQEAAIVGGIGSCGRELCCSTWLTDFKSVKTDAARYQNIAINMQKLSGQCGRLKCCLNYELDTYIEASSLVPSNADSIKTKVGLLKLQKTDILKGLMFYAYENKWDKYYPFSIEQVNQLVENANKGILIESVYEVIEEKVDVEKEAYEDLVGQISLDTLEKKSNKKRKKKKNNPNGNQQVSGGNANAENKPVAKAPNNNNNPERQQGNNPNPNRNKNRNRNKPRGGNNNNNNSNNNNSPKEGQ